MKIFPGACRFAQRSVAGVTEQLEITIAPLLATSRVPVLLGRQQVSRLNLVLGALGTSFTPSSGKVFTGCYRQEREVLVKNIGDVVYIRSIPPSHLKLILSFFLLLPFFGGGE